MKIFQCIPDLATVVIFLLFILTACDNPVLTPGGETNLASPGELEIIIENVGSGRTFAPQGYGAHIEAYEIVLSGTQALGPISTVKSEFKLENLPLGNYAITVSSLDGEGGTVAVGSAEATVSESKGEAVAVRLLPVMGGEGAVSVDVDWSASELEPGYVERAVAVMTPIGGSSMPMKVFLSDDGLSSDGDFPSGGYVLNIDLYNSGNMVSPMVFSLLVVDGMETSVSEILDTNAFENPPSAPVDLKAMQNGLAVELEWTDASDMETGYEIYRSADGGEFLLIGSGLDANTASWTDQPIVPGTEYAYRVAAVNAFGAAESPETTVKATELVISPGEALPGKQVKLGRSDNYLPVEELLAGFVNAYGDEDLIVASVSLAGGGSVELREGYAVIDTASLPDSSVGETLVLEYTVSIPGMPMNGFYSAEASVELRIVDVSSAEPSAATVTAYVYDDEEEFERILRTYRPPNPETVYDGWRRISNHGFYDDAAAAEAASNAGDEDADLARWWTLKRERGGSMIEYSKNSVYAGLVVPEGQEEESFTLEATVVSKDDDDDTAGLIVAFVRDGGENYVLEAARSQGSATGGNRYIEPQTGWGLIARRLYPDAGSPPIGEVIWSRQLDAGGISGRGWRGASTRIYAERDGSAVTVAVSDWDETETYLDGSRMTIDLNGIPELARFRGPRPYGFFTASQERTGFFDIEIEGGAVLDKVFYIDPGSGESEVWWYDAVSEHWIRIADADIRDVLGENIEAVNPETGRRYRIE